MAIDTKAKRMNMLSVACPLAWQLLPEIDSGVAADDRAQYLHIYGGNPLDPPGGATTIMNQFQKNNLGADLFNGTFQ